MREQDKNTLNSISEIANQQTFCNHLVETYYDDFAMRITRYYRSNPEFAKELVQIVFLKAFQNYEKLKVHENPMGWLYLTAKKTAYELYKKSARYAEMCKKLESELNVTIMHDSTPSCDESLTHLVLNALENDEASRQLIVDYYISDHSLAEIAAKLGLDKTVVKSRLYRLHQRLKKLFSENPLLFAIIIHIYFTRR